MKQFELRQTYRGKDITAFVLQHTNSVHISLYGGDLSHIGAIGIVDLEGRCTVTQFSGHKEGSICKKWCDALSAAGFCPVVVEAGIHYDRLDKSGIIAVLDVLDMLLNEALTELCP